MESMQLNDLTFIKEADRNLHQPMPVLSVT